MTEASRTEQLLAELGPALAIEAETELRVAIELDGAAARHAWRDRMIRDRATAIGSLREIDRRGEAHREELARTEAELRQLPDAGAVLPLVRIGGALVCFATEFALSLSSLPYAFSLPDDSVLGVAISAAPVAAAIVIDVVYDRLFESPYRARGAIASRWRRALATAPNLLLFALLAGLCLYMVVAVSDLREAAMADSRVLDGGSAGNGSPGLATPIIARAVLALALAATVGGAVLLGHAMADLRAMGPRARARRAVVRLSTAIERVEQDRIAAQARVAELIAVAAGLDERAALEQDRREAELRVVLAAAIGQLPVEDRIERALRRRVEDGDPPRPSRFERSAPVRRSCDRSHRGRWTRERRELSR